MRLAALDDACIEQGLFDMGMDSLMAVELKSWLEKDTGLTFSPTLTFNYPTIKDLAHYLMGELLSQETSPHEHTSALGDSNSHRSSQPVLETLTEDELATLLSSKLDELKYPHADSSNIPIPQELDKLKG